MTGLFEIIGQRVRAEREKIGLSQGALAELVGVKREAISRLERGQNATIAFLARVAHALQLELGSLFAEVSLTKALIAELEDMSKPRGGRSS